MFGYRICKFCNRIFPRQDYNQKFCNNECKKQYYLIRSENVENIKKSRYIIFERDEFKCVYCGRSSIEDGVVLCVDHIDPYYFSQNNNIYNLITACWDCNSTKIDKHLTPAVYNRIIKENRRRNKGISEDSQAFVSTVMELYFSEQKENYAREITKHGIFVKIWRLILTFITRKNHDR